jgi:hypothetical protein
MSDNDAKGQSPAINAPNNSGIVTQNQSGGTNIINQGPPRRPNGLYQGGREIGTFERSAALGENGISISNVRITQVVDLTAPIEIQKWSFQCANLFKQIAAAQGPNPPAQIGAIFIGTFECTVAGISR